MEERTQKDAAVLDDRTARELRSDVFGFLRGRTGDAVVAEELTQEALARALASLEQLRDRASLTAWVRRIAANLWADELRRRAASPVDAAAPGWIVEAIDSLVPGPARESPDRSVDERATRACLLDAVDRLPPAERAALLAHELEDKPLARAATELGCTSGAAKVRVHRARRRLSEICHAECVEDTTADGEALCTPRTSNEGGADNGRDPRSQDPATRGGRSGPGGKVSGLLHQDLRHARGGGGER
jgi:RNA polymerase sigma-70 factor (ECF subfamily)